MEILDVITFGWLGLKIKYFDEQGIMKCMIFRLSVGSKGIIRIKD